MLTIKQNCTFKRGISQRRKKINKLSRTKSKLMVNRIAHDYSVFRIIRENFSLML